MCWFIMSFCSHCTQMLSHVLLFATPWTVPTRILCPWGSPLKNTGVGCHFPPPWDLPDPRIESTSPALAGRLFTPSSTWEVTIHAIRYQRLMRWYQNCWLHLQVVSCLSLLVFFDEKKSTPATSKNICLCLVSRLYCQIMYSGFIIMKIVYQV